MIRRNLLIVEDDEKIRKMMCMYFQKTYTVFEAENGEDALLIVRTEKIDLCFLDLMLPGMDGIQVCRKIRETSDMPIIMITARSQEEDKVLGYDTGADGYITKPFSLKVLAAKTEGLMRRVEGEVSQRSRILQVGTLMFDLDNDRVSSDGEDVLLTRKEQDLLLLLVRNRNLVLTKELILDRVWGLDYEGDPRTLDTTMKRLRAKLGANSQYLETVRGRGYRFADPQT
jgi:DNA-binding response OmpR family regulator